MNSIIPSNNSTLQHTLAKLTERELAELDWRVIIRAHDPQECDPAFLPFLAWENSISDAEGWRFAETEAAQRALIADYIAVHQGKGTPAVIRQLFEKLQFGEIEIVERPEIKDPTISDDEKWAYYSIVLKRVITVQEAELIKYLLKEIAPARCRLLQLDYRENPLYWDGEIDFSGNYTFGASV